MNMAAEQDRPNPLWMRMAAALTRQPILDSFSAGGVQSRIYEARMLSGFLNRFALQYRIFGSAGAAETISPELRKQAQAGRAEYYSLREIDELWDGSVIERVTGLCLRGYTNNQLLRDIDATSMSHSLEVRVPYLDKVLIDLVLSLPDQTKLGAVSQADSMQKTYRSTGAKRILIDIGKAYLPKDFDIQPKRGFAMPFEQWLADPLQDIFLDALSDTAVRKRGWFDIIVGQAGTRSVWEFLA
jgi:asparagine synthase (glutamine-hydrolysing)